MLAAACTTRTAQQQCSARALQHIQLRHMDDVCRHLVYPLCAVKLLPIGTNRCNGPAILVSRLVEVAGYVLGTQPYRPTRENCDRLRQPFPPRNRAWPLPARPQHLRSGCVLHMRGNPFPATWSGSRYKGGALHDRGLTTLTGISLRLRI